MAARVRLTRTWATWPVVAARAGTPESAVAVPRVLAAVEASSVVVVPVHVPVASVQATEHWVRATDSPSPAMEPLVRALTGAPATLSVMPAAEASDPVFLRVT